MTAKLAGLVLSQARAQGLRLATAESCTGGMVAAALTGVAGSSDVFEGGYVTYSNAAKTRMLGVQSDTLAQYGAVSDEVAREMATGALARSGADIAVSITGIAGPGGGSVEKPVGTVCFAVASAFSGVIAQTHLFANDGRQAVRQAATRHALHMLGEAIAVQTSALGDP